MNVMNSPVRLNRKCRTEMEKWCKAMLNMQCQVGTTGECHPKYATTSLKLLDKQCHASNKRHRDMICTTVYGNKYSTTSVTAQDSQCRRVNMQRRVKDKSRTSFSDQEHGTVDPGLRVEYLA